MDIENMPFKNSKKISINIDAKILEIIDDFSKLTNSNRTITILAFMKDGANNLFDNCENAWGLLLKNTSKNKVEKIRQLIQDLKKIREKYNKIING